MTPRSEVSRRRLARLIEMLIESGRCEAKEATKYIRELKRMAKVSNPQLVEKQSRFFRVLADGTRLKILKLLRAREMCVCEVMIALGLTQPTASHHLGLLDNTGFVSKRKEGKWVFYRLSNPALVEKMHRMNLL